MEEEFRKTLSGLPLGDIRYFDRIGSTNDEALTWAARGATDCSLVIANEQTSGRGRLNRTWFTPRDSALAFSLILIPTKHERSYPSRTTGLLALSLVETLQSLDLAPAIKWPNDVVLHDRKLAGILVESSWTGDKLDALVLGMGVNIKAASIPPADQILFPATSVEIEAGHSVVREQLLRDILSRLLIWRAKIGTPDFIKTWEQYLAFQEQMVEIETGNGESIRGITQGLDTKGGLRLQAENGKIVTINFGDVRLRPLA